MLNCLLLYAAKRDVFRQYRRVTFYIGVNAQCSALNCAGNESSRKQANAVTVRTAVHCIRTCSSCPTEGSACFHKEDRPAIDVQGNIAFFLEHPTEHPD